MKSKAVPLANMLKRLFQVEADLTSNSCEWKLELGKPIFARLLLEDGALLSDRLKICAAVGLRLGNSRCQAGSGELLAFLVVFSFFPEHLRRVLRKKVAVIYSIVVIVSFSEGIVREN